MPRNSAGTYTLPNPPVVPGTTIEAADENTTRDDIGTELTASLDRSGRGGMLAPFKAYDGTLALPGISFANDPDIGIYRSASNLWHMVTGALLSATIAASYFALQPGGNEALRALSVASAVNYVTVSGAVASSGPIIASAGSDTNVDLRLATKGTGSLRVSTSGTTDVQLVVTATASAVNYWQFTGNVASSAPYVLANGSDTNIGLALITKGTGIIRFASHHNYNNPNFQISATASAVNYIAASGAAAAGYPAFTAAGSDTDIGFAYVAKGAGQHLFYGQSSTLQFAILPIASSVNYLRAQGAGASAGPVLSAQGADANINISIAPKGSGTVSISNATIASGSFTGTATISGGSITGITDLAIADGGTGASDAATAFANLKQAASDSATGVVEIATNAEVLAASDTTRVVTPGRLIRSPSAVKKSGTISHASGTPSFTGDFGFSSITDNGTGDITVNFSGNFSSTAYQPHWTSGSTMGFSRITRTTSSATLLTQNTSGVATDVNGCVSIVGELA